MPTFIKEAVIRNMKPGTEVKDTQVPALHLRKGKGPNPKFVFCIRYKDLYGRKQRMVIGTYPAFTVMQARSVAAQRMFALARGVDPILEAEAMAKTPTVAEVSYEYMRDVIIPRRSRPDDYERLFANYIRPALGNYRIDELNADHVRRFHMSLRRKPATANMVVYTALSPMYRYAARRRLVPFTYNPCQGIEKFKQHPRRRYARPEEMERIAAALIKRQPLAPRSVAFILLLIMTGARKSEIANARLGQLHGNRLELKESKTGFRVIQLSDMMVKLIESLPRTQGDDRLIGVKTADDVWHKVRKEAGVPDLRLHDLRHSFASQGLAAGLSLEVVGQLLGHSSVMSTKRYAHLVEDKAKSAVEETTALIADMMKGGVEKIIAQQEQLQLAALPPRDAYTDRPDIPENFKKALRRRKNQKDKLIRELRERKRRSAERKAKKAAHRAIKESLRAMRKKEG